MISEPTLAMLLRAVPLIKAPVKLGEYVVYEVHRPDYAAMARLVAARYGPVVKALIERHQDCPFLDDNPEYRRCDACEALAAVEGKG